MKNMKGTLVLVGVLVAMGLLYWVVVRQKEAGAVPQWEYEFAVRDTAAVQEIKLTLFENEQPKDELVLRRTPGGIWTVNEQYTAIPRQVAMLLQTLRDIQMRQSVNDSLRVTVFNNLKRRHIRVEVDSDAGEDRVFYVGGQTLDGLGTHFLMKGADNPYIVEIPGFSGYLTPRFQPLVNNWRENILFDIPAERIRSIEVKHLGPDTSFVLSRPTASAPWALQSGERMDQLAINKMLERYGRVYAFSDAPEFLTDTRARDSLRRLSPLILLTVNTFDNQQTTVKVYKRRFEDSQWIAITSESDTVKNIQWAVAGWFFPNKVSLLAPDLRAQYQTEEQ